MVTPSVAAVIPSVAAVVGAGAREIRLDAGVTLEEMARAAQFYGLPWTSGRVGDFESGRTAPSLPTLVAAAAALGEAIGRPVPLAELVTGRGQVQINDKLSLDRSALRAALSGDSFAHRILLGPTTALAAQEMLNKSTSTTRWPKRLRAITPDLRLGVWRDFRESDGRMCKNIGVDQVLGAAAMAALWGRTFTAERDHRAGPDAKAQRRGQISRQLKAELQEVINDGNN
jgi:transcriptional regulator with XRE-family HTH domain